MPAFLYLGLVSLFAFFAFEPPQPVVPSSPVIAVPAEEFTVKENTWFREQFAQEDVQGGGSGEGVEVEESVEEIEAVSEEEVQKSAAPLSDEDMPAEATAVEAPAEAGDAGSPVASEISEDPTDGGGDAEAATAVPVEAVVTEEPQDHNATVTELLATEVFIPEAEIPMPVLVLEEGSQEESVAVTPSEDSVEEAGDIVELLQEQP